MSKKLVFGLALVAAVVTYFGMPAFADDEKTVTGEGKCGKCAMKQTEKCQNVIEVKEGDKTVTYWLVDNEVSKKFHANICQAPAKVTATGTLKEDGGKQMLTATKIELAK